MKKFLVILLLHLAVAAVSSGIDLTKMEQIGPIASAAKSDAAVVFKCRDGSQVSITPIAPDLVRIRASFKKALPVKDHSWALAGTNFNAPKWEFKESADRSVISTEKLEISVQYSPLIIEFRDAKTKKVINADAQPMLFQTKGSSVAALKKLGFDEYFYGLGEKAARLEKRRGSFTMWNTDKPGYVEGDDPLYQSVPFYIGLQQGAAYGIFFDNTYRSNFDFGKTSQQYVAFSSEGGEMNYYFFYGPSIKDVLSRYADLTGRMPMPPMWALGNQQSRWSYYPDTLAEQIVRTYREKNLPLDTLYLDIDYMSGYRVFTWDKERFPDPKGFTEKLKKLGVKVVAIVDPGVKQQPPKPGAKDETQNPELASQENSYYVYNQGVQKNYFLKRANLKPYVGDVWPGKSVFVDYTLTDASKWWGDLHKALLDQGVAGIWNDMNEPSDFVDQTGKSQADVVSYDEGEKSSHAKNRNVFALLMSRSTYEGLERLEPEKRHFVLTRAGSAGIQRYAATWTGDNKSDWESLALSIPMLLSLGLSGQPFVGADIGGFVGRADGELLTRWYQVGFLTPLCRNHKAIDGYDQEPWRYGGHYEEIIRKHLKLRYRLLPYLYGFFEEANRTGVPVFRPLVLNYQNDPSALNIDDQFMVGDSLLVAPVLKPGVMFRTVYLPEGDWYDFWTGKKFFGKQLVRADAPIEIAPIFVRAGSVIPSAPEMNYIGEKPFDPMTFVVYPDDDGKASGTLYEDDGTSMEYKKGAQRRTSIKMTRSGDHYQLISEAPEGKYNPGARRFVFSVRNIPNVERVTADGKLLDMINVNDKKDGWYKEGDGVSIQISDNGQPHKIEID